MINTTPSLEKNTREVNSNKWDDIYILGDVHGCSDELHTLLGRLQPTDRDLVLFVGDLIRKGPYSQEVVNIVRANPNYQSIRGNNEQKILDGQVNVPELDETALDWLESLPAIIKLEDDIIAHGGLNPTAEEHSLDEVVTVRSLVENGTYGDPPYWWQKHEAPPRVFFGHTVLTEPLVTPNVVGLDTGCVYGGKLTAYDWRQDSVTEQVTANKAYQERPNSVILNPEEVR